MKIKNNRLTVLHHNGSFTDYSEKAANLTNNSFVQQLLTNHELYIGYKKPINQIFIELKVVNTANSILHVEQYNGTSWVDLASLDETEGFKKSGFIYFDEDSNNTKLHTVNGKQAYWYRIKTSVNTSATLEFMGINLVFCNLEDLRKEEPSIEKFYPREIQSHINSMVAARDLILRKINNSDSNKKYYPEEVNEFFEGVKAVDFTQFDLFNIDEIRDAATFYTLHKIFSNRSDETDDVYRQKALDYLEKFENTFKLWAGRRLELDRDEDGKLSAAESKQGIKTIRLIR